MKLTWTILASITISITHAASTPAKRDYDSHNYYVLEHTGDGAPLAEVARNLGVEVVEQAGELQDTWLLRTPKPRLEIRDDGFDPVIAAFEDLRARASSDLSSRSEEGITAREIISSVIFLERQIPRELVKRAPPSVRPSRTATPIEVAQRLGFKDPLFTEQWHLVNEEFPEHMMNVTPVWDMGFTGKGVLTSFLDDGLDFESDDLKDAFSAEHSYDFNAHVPLPRPTGVRDHHGTRCAGQVAARRNDACGVGIAYNAKAAGVRILGGPISTVDEAAALNYGFNDVGIYSCSWGPRDNGQTMEGPSYIIRKAVTNGINNGRGGKGSIFVFASGNGGRQDDQCNFDGYTNSIYSVTVSSVDYKGLHPSYSEACAANMIVAYSSGSGNHIVTTDRGKSECSKTHGGTSAAAPNAVGVFALALEARPDLTWRDIQHLCVKTARIVNPSDPDWERMATGQLYSYKYGFGALDASAYVKAAQQWTLVKPQAWIHTETVQFNNGTLFDLGHKKYKYEGGDVIGPEGIKAKMTITKEMMEDNNLEALEHIDVRVWISHSKRGDVEVELVSPNGIRSVLAGAREFDESDNGFPGWRFMTLKHWGENPIGEWTIKVSDQKDPEHTGKFLGWKMALWGSAIDPQKAKKFVEPVVDNALPPSQSPPRPVINDPDAQSTTQHAKPTDNLPTDHGHATGENTNPAFPSPTRKPTEEANVEPGQSWFDNMSNVVTGHKVFFGFGALITCLVVGVVFIWRRRQARHKMAQYASLTTDDIHMENVGQERIIAGSGGPRTTRALYDSFGVPSADDLPAQRTANINPPSARGLGFHSSFLDDDEPSAGLSPSYRDEPASHERRSVDSSVDPENASYRP